MRILEADGAELSVRGVWNGGVVESARIGIYAENSQPRRFADTSSVMSAIDAAETVSDLQSILSAFAQPWGISLHLVANASSPVSGLTVSDILDSDPSLRPTAKGVVDALSAYPGQFFAGAGFSVSLVKSPTLNGSPIGAVAYGSLGRIYLGLHSSVSYSYEVFHHEFEHIFAAWARVAPARTKLLNRINQAQPPGFTYGTEAAYTGEHPIGFEDPYGRTNAFEETACHFAALMTPSRCENIQRYIQTDLHLRMKIAAMLDYMEEIGLGRFFAASSMAGVLDVQQP